MAPPLCIVGPSQSGKTMLMESLIGTLEPVATVATIKSIHHDISVDTPGKDTHRHRTSGADTVVGITPTLSFEITPGGKRAAESEAAALKSTVADLRNRDYDVILIEGFHDAPYPKLVVGDRDGVKPPVVARGDINSFDVEDLAAGIINGTLFDDVDVDADV